MIKVSVYNQALWGNNDGLCNAVVHFLSETLITVTRVIGYLAASQDLMLGNKQQKNSLNNQDFEKQEICHCKYAIKINIIVNARKLRAFKSLNENVFMNL